MHLPFSRLTKFQSLTCCTVFRVHLILSKPFLRWPSFWTNWFLSWRTVRQSHLLKLNGVRRRGVFHCFRLTIKPNTKPFQQRLFPPHWQDKFDTFGMNLLQNTINHDKTKPGLTVELRTQVSSFQKPRSIVGLNRLRQFTKHNRPKHGSDRTSGNTRILSCQKFMWCL